MEENFILILWNKYLGSRKGFAKDRQRLLRKPEIDYVGIDKLDLWFKLVDALLLWRFIIKHRAKGSVADLRQTLDQVLLSPLASNEYVKVVAMIEYLPTKVWRKMLWKLNLDFVGFEPFLRRLKSKQISAITDNFLDFKSNKVPRVFSWYEKIFKKISYQTLLADEQLGNRYFTKSAWSYNLLNLDFGFNAYPNGEYDDTEVIEISPFVFLSHKKHADDFTVNQEFGRYFSLYKFVRSNYVYFPNKEVQLKTHICPGFWYTLIMNLIFWVISPLCAIVALPNLSPETSIISWEFFIALVGFFTTAWVAVSLVKLSTINLINLIKKFPEYISKALLNFIVSVFAPFGFASVIGILLLVSWHLGSKNIIETVLIFSYLMFFLKNKFSYSLKKIDFPKSELQIKISPVLWHEAIAPVKIILRSIALLVLVVKVVNNFDLAWHVVTIIIDIILIFIDSVWYFLSVILLNTMYNFIVDLFAGIMFFFKEMTDYSLIFIIILFIPVLFMMLMRKYTDEKQHPVATKIVLKLSNVLPIVLMILTFLVVFKFYLDYKDSSLLSVDSSATLAPLVIFYLLIISVVIYFVQNKYKYDKRLDQAIVLFKSLCGPRSRFISLAYASLESKWFLGLSLDDKKIAAKLIFNNAGYISSLFNGHRWSDDYLDKTYCLMFKYINSFDVLNRINDMNFSYYIYNAEGLGFLFFKDFIARIKETKMSLGQIIDAIRIDKYSIEAKKIENRERIFVAISQKIIQPVAFPFKKIWVEYIKTLYKFYELFNKLCPYNAKSKNLLKS